MTGADSLATARDIQSQLVTILQGAGFKLRKWCANHPRLLQDISREDQEIQLDFTDDNESSVKTLGLTWLPKTDQFCVKTNWSPEKRITKRAVASDIARLFDPLGIMTPVVVTAKILLQKLWELKLDWDAGLPMELHTRWRRFREGLQFLNNIQFPRHIFASDIPRAVQFHAFCDASGKAYGAAIYVRSINREGRVIVRLLCAKSKVTPPTRPTLPRLELCGAKLAAELVKRVKRNLKMEDAVTYMWTDSEIVLAWINTTPSSLPTFVANRVTTIQEITIVQQWRHVRSKDNPADVLSRGLAPEKLGSCNLWFYGPLYLHGKESIWPPVYVKRDQCEEIQPTVPIIAEQSVLPVSTKQPAVPVDTEKQSALPVMTERSALTVNSEFKGQDEISNFIERINHKNSFRRLQRIVGYVLRFLSQVKRSSPHIMTSRTLTAQELDKALFVIIKTMQAKEFEEDVRHLKKYKETNKRSPLLILTPFLDEKGILRVGGRLEAANLPIDAKHPILLPYSHEFTKLLMSDLHRENHHVGPQGLLSITRQRFWPMKGKTIARSVVQRCIRCAKSKPKMLTQIMGNLPPHRVQPARPFVNAGVDFCGPIWVHYKIRGKRPQKAYIAVFCCFATKAVHLEIVSDLSSNAFIGALKRFTGRRGHCRNLYCDNATNFVGARNQLTELNETIYSDQAQQLITSACNRKGIDFHFIPPSTPHFGGLWEAAVKSAKHLLYRTVASASLTHEELETVIIEIEAILNSRPLTPMSSNPNDLTAITPGHFLIGEPLTSSIDSEATPLKVSLLTRWKLVSQLKEEFWKRWSLEYLHELQHRSKWNQCIQNVKLGTIVIIQEDNVPAMKWPLGRIVKIYKGKDGHVRVADVRTATNVLQRPIHKLAPLPCEAEYTDTTPETQVTEKEVREGRSNHRNERQSASRSTDDVSESPKKKARKSYGSAVVTLLLACLIFPTIKGEPITVTNFKSQIGIHFENIGTTKLITTEWKLIVYYELQPYWMEVAAVVNGTKTLQHLCNQLRQKSYCRQIVSQFQHLQQELDKDNEFLTTQRSSTRQRRGAFNIVGNIANSLFGVLDSQYAEDMSQTIDSIKENEGHLVQLLKNQTSIMDSTINIIERDQAASEAKFRALDQHITELINRINDNGEENSQIKILQHFTALAIQLTLITTNLQRIQAVIIDVLIDTHHGRINPLLVSPFQLRHELANVRNQLPPSLRVPTSQDNILELYKLMTIEGRVIDNRIIFRLKMPLVNSESFDLFRVLPIPTLLNNTFIAVEPYSPFLAITPHRDHHYPITDQELSSCTIIEGEVHLCKQLHPIYRRGASISACEVEFLNNAPNATGCKLSQINHNPIWIQLSHTNQWIFALKTSTTINVVCNERAFPAVLNGSGLLKIQPDCIIKENLVTIQGHQIYPSSTRTSYTQLGISSNILRPDRIPIILNGTTQYHAQMTSLQNLHKQIVSMNLTKLPNKVHAHTIHQFSISYLGLSLTILIAVFLIWKFRMELCRCHQAKPQPLPRQSRNLNYTVDV